MSDVKMPARSDDAPEPAEQLRLRRLVEINRDVAAEYGVERALHRPVRQHQVEWLERHQRLGRERNADGSVGAALEEARPLARQPAQLALGIDAMRRLGDDIGVDVGGK